MHPKLKGNIAELKVLTRFIELGFIVSKPFGENQRYDFIIDKNNDLSRVQVKSTNIVNGRMEVRSHSNGYNSPSKSYKNDCEYIAAYCFDNDNVYLVPINEANERAINLRIDGPKNNQKKNIKWAKDYKL